MQNPASPGAAPTSRGLVSGERVFGRFTLGRILGRGGMGVVWLARDETLEGDVALKFLPDAVRWDPAALAALRRETRRSRELTHPHIVRVHDIHEDAGAAAIAMEYLAGGSLHHARADRTPPVFTCAEIAAWLPGVCAALDHAHAQGVVHRDLKPANLLVAPDGAVKISDFGIAQLLFETSLRISQWAPSGTLAYMSPQQHFGDPAAASDDLYALGATLYELLTGKPPFYTGNVAAQIERRPPDRIAERRRQLRVEGEPVAEHWEETIAACLAKRAEERPAKAGEIAARLAAPATKPARSSGMYSSAPEWGRLRAKKLVGLGLLALSVSMAAWILWLKVTATSAVPIPVHASDATRSLGAWNLNGDGQEASGRGWHLSLNRAVPTTDRHGRIDRALSFNGNAALTLDAPDALRWAGRQPFTVALWVKPVGTETVEKTLVVCRTEVVGEHYWQLTLSGGVPHFIHSAEQVDEPSEVSGPQPLPSGRWSHLIAEFDGHDLRLLVDGREVARRPAGARSRGARAASAARLMLGQAHKFDANKFVGDLDELRIWTRPLEQEDVERLAAREPAPHFQITRGTYADTDDLAGAVAREFGRGAIIADWDDFRRWHRDDAREIADEAGLTSAQQAVFLLRAGQRHSTPPRHYFINRFNGVKPEYFLAHEELGGMTLALGSWYGFKGPVMARRPFVAVRDEPLARAEGGMVGRFPADPATEVIALRWQQEFSRGSGPQLAEAHFVLRNGRELRAVCRASGGETFALALGDAVRPELARETGAAYDRVEFTVVLRAGRMEFRAISGVGGNLLFRETVALPGFVLGDIATLMLPGVDFARLTVEE